ncbi:MAG: hypothetical protein KAJ95_03430, partial [Gammaproteobacteria bacterium]|nr:hypothetical protein [Gammaproteobacteria bacterium]
MKELSITSSLTIRVKNTTEYLVMYKSYFFRVSIFASLALLSFSASSAEVISQDQALAYALEHSPVLHGTASGVRARSEQIKSAE